jgi:hypothetical protein
MVAAMIIIVVIPIFCVGLFMVVGCLKNINYLVEYQDYGIFSGIYPLLNKLGRHAVKIYHMIIGMIFIYIALRLLIYFTS